jgi:hypothetical protein
MIIERTHYFAHPGKAEQVLAIRRRACAVRLTLGLPAGDIFVKQAGGDGSEPDVAWQCGFADEAEQAADLAARAASGEFAAVRADMTAAIARFERQVFRRADLALASGMRTTSLSGHPIAPREISFVSGGFTLKGWLHLPPGKGPFPCMVTNHGSTIEQGTEDISRPGTAALLISWGIASDDVLAALDVVAALPEIRRDHIGVMGSSFGGVNTLLAAAKSDRFRCAVEFAGAAMNWDRTPGLRALMLEAAARLRAPIFFIQAENDYSIRPTRELAASLVGTGKIMQSKIYPPFGVNNHEAHLLESRGPAIWAEDVRRFLERHL